MSTIKKIALIFTSVAALLGAPSAMAKNTAPCGPVSITGMGAGWAEPDGAGNINTENTFWFSYVDNNGRSGKAWAEKGYDAATNKGQMMFNVLNTAMLSGKQVKYKTTWWCTSFIQVELQP